MSFDAEISCSPIIADDEVLGAVIAFRDVTRRNVLERELERAKRLSSIGQLAATIAHEFNNVMMGIAPFADLMRRKAGSDEAMRAMAGHVSRAVRRGKQITSEILKFGQVAEPDIHPILVRDLLESSLDELRAIAGPGVKIALAPVGESLAIRADLTQIQQILSNLVANARDAMAERGTIEIDASALDTEYVRISIRDHGAGIDEQLLEAIFEPLFTTKKAGGTGLGLAVVQQLVAKHHARIEVESKVGEGTVFHLDFRRCEPPGRETGAATAARGRPVHRIVLIEDDENVSVGLSEVLRMEGIEVQVVTHGAQAEQEVERFQPDAVVLDRGLPDIDGIEVYRRLAARWPDLPVVFSTGHGRPGEIEEMLGLPHVGYLLKPYDVDALLTVLRTVVGVG